MTINDITDKLPKHKFRTYRKRFLDKIEYIVLHHTVGKGTPKAFAKYHISKGWPGIGYHFLIDKEGKVYQTNRLDTISYNVALTNTKVLGIAVIGNYETKNLNTKQKRSLTELVKLLRALVGNKPVVGHNKFRATLCPGKYITEYIKKYN